MSGVISAASTPTPDEWRSRTRGFGTILDGFKFLDNNGSFAVRPRVSLRPNEQSEDESMAHEQRRYDSRWNEERCTQRARIDLNS